MTKKQKPADAGAALLPEPVPPLKFRSLTGAERARIARRRWGNLSRQALVEKIGRATVTVAVVRAWEVDGVPTDVQPPAAFAREIANVTPGNLTWGESLSVARRRLGLGTSELAKQIGRSLNWCSEAEMGLLSGRSPACEELNEFYRRKAQGKPALFR